MSLKTSLALAVLLIPALACSALSGAEPTATPTEVPTDTPQPTATETSTPLPTPDRTGTAEVVATATAEAVLELVGADLAEYGYSTDEGQLLWQNSVPISIDVRDFNVISYEDLGSRYQATHFILHVDITWESTSGLASCGLVFRSGEDIVRDRQAQFWAWRLSGFPAWDFELWEFGDYVTDLSGSSSWEVSSAIRQGQGSTNEYLFIVQENTATAYVNDTRLGVGNLPQGLRDGHLAFFTYQESGETTCTFDNIWLWELPDEN